MSEIKVAVVHAGAREVRTTTTGTKAWELFADDASVIAARVNDHLRDLAHELADGDEVEGVAIDSKDGRDILRHSTAHVMAQAVQDLFPDARLGIGPPVENGFYYDFDVETPFVPEDLEKIETRMRKIIKEGQRFSRRPVADADALVELEDEPYKLELIGLKGSGKAEDAAEGANVEVGAGELTIYDNVRRDGEVAWSDLCRGPHLPTTKRIPAFKLMRSAAAYWRGDEKNKQLQRLYGTAWETKEALAEHLHRIEEAERRDHRKLGRELDLYSFPDELGSGLVVFHPKGGVIKREMEDYVRRRHIEEGFSYVGTPHISKDGLFHTSGHLPYYADHDARLGSGDARGVGEHDDHERHGQAVDTEGEEAGRRALLGALGADHVERVGLPVADRALGTAAEVARRATEVLTGVAQQDLPGRGAAPGRLGALGRGLGVLEDEGLEAGLDGHGDAFGLLGLALDGVDDPVADPADAGLQRPQQLAGADELLPAGQHLAAQQGAVGRRLADRGHGPVVGLVGVLAQAAYGVDLLGGGVRHRVRMTRQRADRAVQRLLHHRLPGLLVLGQGTQPLPDLGDRRRGQQPHVAEPRPPRPRRAGSPRGRGWRASGPGGW